MRDLHEIVVLCMKGSYFARFTDRCELFRLVFIRCEEFANQLQIEQRQNLQKVQSLEQQLQQRIQQNEASAAQRQSFLTARIQELQQQIKNIKPK